MPESSNNICLWWKKPWGFISYAGFGSSIGIYLIIFHQQHLLGALPFLIILICPFMHKGCGNHNPDKDTK